MGGVKSGVGGGESGDRHEVGGRESGDRQKKEWGWKGREWKSGVGGAIRDRQEEWSGRGRGWG